MLSLVIIGNSESRAVSRGADNWVYAPRGYTPQRTAETRPAAREGWMPAMNRASEA